MTRILLAFSILALSGCSATMSIGVRKDFDPYVRTPYRTEATLTFSDDNFGRWKR